MPSEFASVLLPESWPFNLEWLPVPAYMVGGAVRDALLQRRREYLDLDFVIPVDAVKTARAIYLRYADANAHHDKAGFVLLDAERQIARVVFPNATADFAQQEGATLETDLLRRDFTINAIAYNPHTQELIDPLHGYADLQQGTIRMVSPKNLQDDPLRLLRAYRQAAQLAFIIEPETRATIRQLAPLLGQIAAERVRVELGYLLSSPQGTPWLTTAWEDGILRYVLHDNVTAANLSLLAAVDQASITLAATWPQLGVELSSPIPGLAADAKRTWLAVAKLASLLIPPTWLPNASLTQPLLPLPVVGGWGLPSTQDLTVNYTRAGVTVENASVEEFLRRMTYSVPEIRAVTTIFKFLLQLQPLSMSVREQYFLFRDVGAVFPALAVVAVAWGMEVDKIAPLINRYLNPNDQVAHPTQLVSGNDLIKALKLQPSPKIGQLLTEIQLARIEGKISTPADALAFAAQIVDTQ